MKERPRLEGALQIPRLYAICHPTPFPCFPKIFPPWGNMFPIWRGEKYRELLSTNNHSFSTIYKKTGPVCFLHNLYYYLYTNKIA
jgi:hypothetical protein